VLAKHSKGLSFARIAREYSVSEFAIRDICLGKSWRDDSERYKDVLNTVETLGRSGYIRASSA
jgi:hypothetical protein